MRFLSTTDPSMEESLGLAGSGACENSGLVLSIRLPSIHLEAALSPKAPAGGITAEAAEFNSDTSLHLCLLCF